MSSEIAGPMYDGINNAAMRNFSTVTEVRAVKQSAGKFICCGT